mgnify:CR=1 FL=1
MDNLIIDLDRNQETLTVKLKGRLESATSPQLEEALELEGIKDLRMDFAGLEYLSSAGLRVLLAVSKTMKKQGTMEISNVNEEVMEVFIITGFAGILTIL